MDIIINPHIHKDTINKQISIFPMRKYTTFKNVMLKLNLLPVDVIRYIMYMMIDTDKIYLRLYMTASILTTNLMKMTKYNNIKKLNWSYNTKNKYDKNFNKLKYHVKNTYRCKK